MQTCHVLLGGGAIEDVFVEPIETGYRVATIPYLADLYLDDIVACEPGVEGELTFRTVLHRSRHRKIVLKAQGASLARILEAVASTDYLVAPNYDAGLCSIDLRPGDEATRLLDWLATQEGAGTLNYAVFAAAA